MYILFEVGVLSEFILCKQYSFSLWLEAEYVKAYDCNPSEAHMQRVQTVRTGYCIEENYRQNKTLSSLCVLDMWKGFLMIYWYNVAGF